MTVNLYDGNNIMFRQFDKNSWVPQAMSLRQRFEAVMASPPGTQIWVWDGAKHNERRRDIYPQYKMKRPPKPEDMYAQVRLWRDLLKLTHAVQIEVYGWEADDIIGTLVKRKPGLFKVHTNDMDYGQIAHLCDLAGVNMKGVPPRWVALYKAMCGDSSDNIDGIPGFGPGRWLEMKEHWPQIERAIVAGTPAGFVGLPFKPKVKAWLAVPDNVKLLQNMLIVTHFHTVPADEIDGGIIRGEPDRFAAHAIMQEFFL